MFRKEGILFISLGLFFYIASVCALENNLAGQLKQNKAHSVPLPTITEIGQLPQDGGDEFNRLIFEQPLPAPTCTQPNRLVSME